MTMATIIMYSNATWPLMIEYWIGWNKKGYGVAGNRTQRCRFPLTALSSNLQSHALMAQSVGILRGYDSAMSYEPEFNSDGYMVDDEGEVV